MPLIHEIETKKTFKKRNQRPWDLLVDVQENDSGLSHKMPASAPSLMALGSGCAPVVEAVAIELDKIRPDPDQVRRHVDIESEAMAELAESIRVHGVRQPITVFKSDEGWFGIVFGERRFHAAKKAGLLRIPCLLLDAKPAPEQKTILQLIENLHRADMSPIDEAAAYNLLATTHGMTHEQIAKTVGRSRTRITKALQLLHLSPEVTTYCATSHNGEKPLSFEHLLEIARQGTVEEQTMLLDKIRSEGLSVKQMRDNLRPEAMDHTATARMRFKSHKFVDPEDRFWMMLHFKQPQITNHDILLALEKALADVKRAISRAGGDNA